VEDAWLPDGVWQACADPTAEILDGAKVVIALDGSFSRECTALVVATVEDRPHIHLYQLSEAPEGPATAGSRRPGGGRHLGRVCALAADPYCWQRSLEVLDADGIPVSEFFQNAARMGPATARAYALIVDGPLSHDGDPALARHVASAILKADSRGAWLAKEHKDSPGGSTPPSAWSWPCTGPPSWPTVRPPSTRSRGRDRSGCQSQGGRYDPRRGAKQDSTRGHHGRPDPTGPGRISAAARVPSC
jgi:hypothetical protein